MGELIRDIPGVTMQLRPLKQVMVRGDLPELYAHAVSLKDAAKPRLTITTHAMPDGSKVWYLGGNLAEQGVNQTDDVLMDQASRELAFLLSWVDTSAMAYGVLPINRAEPTQDSGLRPDNPFVHQHGSVLTCWPTKLTLTPMLGDEVLRQLPEPSNKQYPTLQLPLATTAPFPWENAFA